MPQNPPGRENGFWKRLKNNRSFAMKLSHRLGWEEKKPFFTIGVIAAILAALGLFLIGIQTISEGAHGVSHLLEKTFGRPSPVRALGIGWLFAYLMLSGSPVAAAALTFFNSGAIDLFAAFTMIVGSRFGAIFVTLFFGLLYYLQGTHSQKSLAVGVIAYLTTFTIAFGSLLVGLAILPWTRFTFQLPRLFSIGVETLARPVVGPLSELLPSWALFWAGLAILLISFKILDRALPDPGKHVDQFKIQRYLSSPGAMFLLGLGITFLTPSVTVSCGILVPFYAKGYIKSSRLVPYVMGANISTFSDTLMAALVINNPLAVHVVMVEVIAISLVSLIVLFFFFNRYESMIERWSQYFIGNIVRLAAFLAVIFLIPLLLIWI
ncbi:MAG TPA: hypothetical protein VIK48_06060 [Candidatus Manganitrophaceae bacterium]